MLALLKKYQQLMVLFVIILGLSTYHAAKNYTSPPVSDGYAVYGYSIKTWGVYGFPNSTSEQPEPSVGRAPLYPLFLAGMMAISPKYNELVKNYIDGKKVYSLDAGIVPYIQMAMMSIVGIVVFLLARMYGSNLLFAYIISFGVLARLLGMAYHFRLSEVLAFPLFALTSYFLALWFKGRPKYSYVFAAGLFLGLLALTRVVHLYFFPFVLLAILLLPAAGGRQGLKQLFSAGCIFMLGFAIVVGPWIWRNATQHHNSAIGDSGTESVYALRMLYNTMTFKEALAGTIYWIPDFGDNLAKKLFPEESKRFDFSSRESFRHQRGKLKTDIEAQLEEGQSLKSGMQQAFITSVIKDPFGHILAMVPLTIRGLRHLWLYLPFSFFALWCLRKDKAQIVAIFGASTMTILTYVIHVGVTHFRGRYGYPMLVGLAPLAALGLTYLQSWGAQKIAARIKA